MEMNNKYVPLLKLILPLLVLITFIFFAQELWKGGQRSGEEINWNLCNKIKSKTIQGIIDSSYWDRGIFTSILNSDDVFIWHCTKENEVYDLVKSGDSILKPSGIFSAYVYKKANPDSLIFIECNFDCDYWIKKAQKRRQREAK